MCMRGTDTGLAIRGEAEWVNAVSLPRCAAICRAVSSSSSTHAVELERACVPCHAEVRVCPHMPMSGPRRVVGPRPARRVAPA